MSELKNYPFQENHVKNAHNNAMHMIASPMSAYFSSDINKISSTLITRNRECRDLTALI